MDLIPYQFSIIHSRFPESRAMRAYLATASRRWKELDAYEDAGVPGFIYGSWNRPMVPAMA
jgi:hypothetical protein